jgi:serine/threonine-protein kinase HipA
VYLHFGGADVPVGQAYFTTRRGSVSSTVQYRADYLTRKGRIPIDPSLPLFSGAHAVAGGLPFAFADAAPDRWGRNLIKKRLHAVDAADGVTRRTVPEVDYLLGVTDATRQGALRFTAVGAGSGGPFLAADTDVPKLIELPRLLEAADRVTSDDDDLDAVKELLDAGTGSLGGARPKASVRDDDRLLIAKFPSPQDDWDVIAWEKTALDLAERAGIRVPRRRLVRVAGRSVLLLDRFDRAAGERIPYISAMTLLTSRDGDGAGLDYLDIAEALEEHGGKGVAADLAELWRRAAFSVALHNTDDHLRNHGFLHDGVGWSLSPVFDVNPNPDTGAARVLGIGAVHSRDDEVDGLNEIAPVFGLSSAQAKAVLDDVFATAQGWRECATDNGVPDRELRLMADAFAAL